MPLDDTLPHDHGNFVSGLDGLCGFDFDVRVDDDQVTHLARTQLVLSLIHI